MFHAHFNKIILLKVKKMNIFLKNTFPERRHYILSNTIIIFASACSQHTTIHFNNFQVNSHILTAIFYW